ncbi:MAG: amidase [Acidimicrobiales bacterium]
MDEELRWTDGVGTARLVRAGDRAATEVVAAALERIDHLNPLLNAVCWRSFERAAEQAAGWDRRRASGDPADLPTFAGVPLLLKDALGHLPGDRITYGSRWLVRHDWRASDTSAVAGRLVAAGTCVAGRTTCPELLLGDTTEPLAHGPVRNPWDPARTPGGSSGGAAAAVAAGLVPIAHGNDTGGSLRIPASLCGLVACKPTRGRVPADPLSGGFSLLLAEGVLGRSVRDVAAGLDVISGPGPASLLGGGLPVAAPTEATDAVERRTGDPRRVAVLTTDADGSPLDPATADAVVRTGSLLADLGHDVETVEAAALGLTAFDEITFGLFPALVAADVRRWSRVLREDPGPDDLEPYVHQLVELGSISTAADLAVVLDRLGDLTRRTSERWDGIDVLLTAATPRPAPELDHYDRGDSMTSFLAATELGSLTGWVNQTGQPAVAVPIGWTPDGLPIGGQVVGRHGDDVQLLALAADLEVANPWDDRRPPSTGA